MIRVLNVNIIIDPTIGGGTAERTLQMSRSLAKSGIECTILTTDLGGTPHHLIDAGVNVISLPCVWKRFYVSYFSYNLIKTVVESVDIVHIMNHWTLLNAITYFFVKRFNKPYVVCPAGAMGIFGRSVILKKLYNILIGKKIIRNANAHITISKDEVGQFREYGVTGDSICAFPNGVEPEDFRINHLLSFKKKFNIGDNPFILFLGRLNYIKGPDLLLRAYCNAKDKIKDFDLVFAGPDDGMLTQLKEEVQREGVSDMVHFTGYLNSEDRVSAYHGAELLVIPSRREAMSIVVLEAAITGTPVLLTRECNFEDVELVGGGMIVSANVGDIEVGLIEMLQDQDKLKLKGANLRQYVEKYFTWKKIAEKYIALYEEILDVERLNSSFLACLDYVSVIVSCYNRKDALQQTLIALSDQTIGWDKYEIIIVDDASSDGTEEYISGLAIPNLRYTRHDKNMGLSAARNTGIKMAHGQLIIFLDSDVAPDNDFIEFHISCHIKYRQEEIAVVSNVRYHYDNINKSNIGRYLQTRYLACRTRSELAKIDYNNLPARMFAGGASSLTKNTLFRTGLFDVSFKFYGCEDVEFGYRLKKAGVRIMFCKAAKVWHNDTISLERHKKKIVETAREGYKILLEKQPDFREEEHIMYLVPSNLARSTIWMRIMRQTIKLLLNPVAVYCLECFVRKTDAQSWLYFSSLYRFLGAAWLLQGLQSKKKGYSEVWQKP